MLHIHMVKKNKSHFQIQKSDFLFLLINAGLKCTTSGPKLALAQLAELHVQCTFQHIQVLVGLTILSQALQKPSVPAGYGSNIAIFIVMHLETEHPADIPLLGLGQQGCPFLQNVLSRLTSPGLTQSLKRITTISGQCTSITRTSK